jgi:hypothetical protein
VEDRITISLAIEIAEAQARLEEERSASNSAEDPESVATWKDTLWLLRYIKEHGIPDCFRDEE